MCNIDKISRHDSRSKFREIGIQRYNIFIKLLRLGRELAFLESLGGHELLAVLGGVGMHLIQRYQVIWRYLHIIHL